MIRLLLVSFLSLQFDAACVAQDDSSSERTAQRLIRELQEEVLDPEADVWVRTMKELVELGEDATVPVCDALLKTQSYADIQVFGFALRAINDPRAIPTLIEAIPKSFFVFTSRSQSANFRGLSDTELIEFVRQHDLRTEDDDRFSIYGPSREILRTLQAISKTELRDSEVMSIYLFGGKHTDYLKRRKIHEHAREWESWWEENWRSFDVSMEFGHAHVPEFTTDRPTSKLAFDSPNIQPLMDMRNIIIEPFDDAERRCFLDLDTGRIGVFDDHARSQIHSEDENAAIDWARQQGFDLLGTRLQVDGYEEPQLVVKPIELEVWQVDADRYDTIDSELGNADFDMGTPRNDYLVFQDSEEKIDPRRSVAFLYKTREGTIGILHATQITQLFSDIRPSFDVADNEGMRLGVKFKWKQIDEN